MGLFSKFMNKQYLTSEWVVQPGKTLEIDFNRHALCNARLSDPVNYLDFLGPVEDKKKVSEDTLCYYSRGLQIDFTDNRIDCYSFFFHQGSGPRFTPFSGIFSFHGKGLMIAEFDTEQTFRTTFGEPWWRDEDDDEIILFYEFKNIEWQVEFDLSFRLQVFMMMTPPMLANPQQREAYGITKEWSA